MNTKPSNLIWGLILIALGGLFLAQNLGYLEGWSPLLWASVFGIASLLFFVAYVINGVQQWGWLFPASIFAGVAGTIYLSTFTDNASVGTPVLAGIAAPFLVVFALNARKNWWALIPGGILLFVTLTTLMVDQVAGEWIGAMLFFIVALAFLVVYLLDHSRRWALLVAYILGVLGVMPLMAISNRAELAGSLVMFAVALPFFFVYFRSAERWWAIIPAGTLTTVGLVVLIGLGLPEVRDSIANALVFAGTAATFVVVWLRHARHWAMWGALIAGLAAVAALLAGPRFQDYWSVILIVIGLLLLYNTLRPSARQR